MPKQTKRDATEAFGENENAPAMSKKRTRRKTKHKDSERPVAGPKAMKQDSASSLGASDATAIVGNAKSSQPDTDLDTRTRNAPSANGGPSSGSGHKRKYNDSGSHPERKPSVNQSSPVVKKGHKGSNQGTRKHKRQANKTRIERRKDRSYPPPKSGWTKSIVGGYFLEQDPLLSQDEQYFLLPTKSHVHVYSAATSLLVRSLFISLVDSVTSCTKCPSHPEHMLVSTYGGTIAKYDWTSGRELQKWKTLSGLIRIHGLPTSKSTDGGDVILAITHRSGGERDLSRLSLAVSPDVPIKEVVLRSQQRMASTVVTLEGGKVIVGFGGDRVMLGSSRDSELGEYTWRDFSVPGKIVSLDARSGEESVTTRKTRSSVDLVVGLQDGAILILDDVLAQPTQKEKGAKDIDRIPRRLHWHRDAVSAVKWSRDGNYLISGGHETVLVIWQLETNQQQYLPHLSTSICNIVVSSSGSSYTLRLGDNSVMMLSTHDLIAKTNIRGVSVSKELNRRVVAAMNPSQPDQLLLATPSDLSVGSQSTLTTLQTFDLVTSHEASRQALVRNLATAVNVNPSGQRIFGPDVVQLQISHDGLWLAVVDEWTPPDTDRESLDLHVSNSTSARKTEIYLKFWSFHKELRAWEMNTKIDGPHSAMPHSVLKLAFNPIRAEVASAGRDGYLRIWRPMLRQRNGMPVKNEAGEPLYTWTCHHEQQPNPRWPPGSQTEADSATLAYSEDGSAIAVSFTFQGRTQILHIIDSRTGVINERGTKAHLCPPGNMEMAFCGRSLLLLSDRLLIWDVVDTMLVCEPIILKEHFMQDNGRFLAVNVFDGTFALALNPADFHSPGLVTIFDANQPGKVVYQVKIHGHVKALLPSVKNRGYVIVDGGARIVQLTPDEAARKSLKSNAGGKAEILKGLNDIFGSSTIDTGIDATVRGAASKASNGEGSTLLTDGRLKSLEDIFEQQAFLNPPPVSELFEKVASLFRKAQ